MTFEVSQLRIPVILLLLAPWLPSVGWGADPSVSREDAYAELQPAASTVESKTVRMEGLSGRVVTGYQGWFRAPGDGSGLGFQHYRKGRRFAPGNCTIDLWPDLSEFDDDERFPTEFKHQDGSTAHVFSSIHPKTVERHFQWMSEYGIDAAFVQRFATQGAKQRRDYRGLKFENRKLMLCRDAAIHPAARSSRREFFLRQRQAAWSRSAPVRNLRRERRLWVLAAVRAGCGD